MRDVPPNTMPEPNMEARLRIELLGGFRATYDGELVSELESPRLQGLLASVVLRPGTPRPRHHLAYTFWPDSTEKQARTNLRQLLFHLRNALPDADHFLEITPKTVCWKADAPCWLDVAQFEAAVERANRWDEEDHRERATEAREEAVRLYEGDLLPACYDEWITADRERLWQHYMACLERLVAWKEERRDYEEAARFARRLLQKDPLRETTYRTLMRLHALRRDRASALRVYHDCVSVLERELGVAPAPATRALHDRLLEAPATSACEAANESPALAGELPLVGRQEPWRRLQNAWRTVRDGGVHFALVSGEAGIGKTRLAEELLAWAARQGTPTARARCYAAEGRLAYAPVADWLRSEPFRDTAQRLDPVWRTEVARILPELLGPDSGMAQPGPLSERVQRRRFFEALCRAVLAASQPAVLLIDDLHWCDRETLEWLHFLLRYDPAARLLVLGTARVEELGADHPLERMLLNLRGQVGSTEISLGPLSAGETAQLARHAASRAIDDGQAAFWFEETEGYPLFVVEGVRAGLAGPFEERGAGSPHGPPAPQRQGLLPPRVRAVLASRLAQLSPAARELADLAAVVGRAFTFEVLVEAGGKDEDAVIRCLDELWQRRVVREYGASSYDFSHDKLREVAYAEIRPARLRLLHRRVAEAFEALYAAERDAFSGQIAAHYERADLPEQALSHYRHAAEVAERVQAHEEAATHLKSAVRMLAHLPPGRARYEEALSLRTRLGAALVAVRGWADAEVFAAYREAHSLCRRDEHCGEESAQLLSVLWGLQTSSIVRADLSTAQKLGEDLLLRAERRNEPGFLVASHLTVGLTSYHLGDPVAARRHLEQALTLQPSEEHSFQPSPLGPDLGVFSHAYASHVWWHLGYSAEARELSRAALARAEALEHPFTRAIAMNYAAMFHQFRRDAAAVRTTAEAALTICREHDFPYYMAWGTILEGWARAVTGEPTDGRRQIEEGLEALGATGAGLRRPYYLALLAEAAHHCGDDETALACLDEAQALARETGECWSDTHLLHLRGSLLLGRDHDDGSFQEARRCLRAAVDDALSRSAAIPALRAARVLHRNPDPDDAPGDQRLLRTVCAAFPDGVEAPEWAEAQALLASCS